MRWGSLREARLEEHDVLMFEEVESALQRSVLPEVYSAAFRHSVLYILDAYRLEFEASIHGFLHEVEAQRHPFTLLVLVAYDELQIPFRLQRLTDILYYAAVSFDKHFERRSVGYC